jgi:DNA-binding transcriptional ArsR family regulator
MTNQASSLEALGALGDPTRRAIFEKLIAHPSAVGELAATLPVSRSAVSQHLRVLKAAGLVHEISKGTKRIYRVDPRGIAAMRDWLDTHWGNAFEVFKNFANDQDEQETHR